MWSAGLVLESQGLPRVAKYGTTLLMSPWYTVWPFSSRISLSKSWKMLRRGWWMVHRMSRPLWVHSFFSVLAMLSAVLLSRPVVGSSKKRISVNGRRKQEVKERRRK